MVITRTPLRIGFVGGGSDLPDYYRNSEKGGSVLNATIDKYIYVIVKKRYDQKIRLGYSRVELVDQIDDLQHELIRESLRFVGIQRGVEIGTIADIPSTGSGLGASGSLTVGILNALWNFVGEKKTLEELAEQACMIEIEKCQRGCGKQDQYAATFGGMNLFDFLPNDEVVRTPIFINPLWEKFNKNFLLFHTGIAKDSKEILRDQVQKGITLYLMSKQPEMAVKLLSRECLEGFLNEISLGWLYKKQLSNKIVPIEIDDMISKIECKTDCYKICGAGGGGYLLVYSENSEEIRQILKDYQELPFRFINHGTEVILNIGD